MIYAMETNVSLFNKFISLSQKLSSLKVIVQNYSVIGSDELNSFTADINELIHEIETLEATVLSHATRIPFGLGVDSEEAQWRLENEIFKEQIDRLKEAPINIDEPREHYDIK